MSGPRHILVANVFFAPNSYGGATVVAEQVARELTRRDGCRVSVVSAMNRTELAPYSVMRTETGGIQNYLINRPNHRAFAESYDNTQVTQVVAGLLDVLRPDLLHAHCLQDLGAGLLGLARRRGIPTVLSVHDFWWICEQQFMIRPSQRYCGQDPVRVENCRGCVDNLARTRARRDTLLAAAAQADLITFPSRFALDLSRRSGMTAPRMEVWENGVQLPGPGFFEAQAERRRADPRTVFGLVGGPSQIKGWPLIRTAFSSLDRDDFAGLLVDGALHGSWWAGHDYSMLKGDWSLYPRFAQKDMDAFYAKIDVLLFLSQWKETFGLAIREAAARGIRVLQTDSGGTTEWDGADRSAMLAIGDGADRLKPLLIAELERPERGTEPRSVASHADQARAFLDMVADLATPRP